MHGQPPRDPSYDIVDDATVLDVADVEAASPGSRPTARSRCSIRSPGRSPSPWPRSWASGPSSSRRISSPATSLCADRRPGAGQRAAAAARRAHRASFGRAHRAPSAPTVSRSTSTTGSRGAGTIAGAAVVDCGFRLPDDPLRTPSPARGTASPPHDPGGGPGGPARAARCDNRRVRPSRHAGLQRLQQGHTP